MPYKDGKVMAEYMRKRYHQRRAEAFEYLGGCCVVCGTRDGLEIDHIEMDKKEISLNHMWSISKKRFFAELGKCQILCKEHHDEKNRKDLSIVGLRREAKRRAAKGV